MCSCLRQQAQEPLAPMPAARAMDVMKEGRSGSGLFMREPGAQREHDPIEY